MCPKAGCLNSTGQEQRAGKEHLSPTGQLPFLLVLESRKLTPGRSGRKELKKTAESKGGLFTSLSNTSGDGGEALCVSSAGSQLLR